MTIVAVKTNTVGIQQERSLQVGIATVRKDEATVHLSSLEVGLEKQTEQP